MCICIRACVCIRVCVGESDKVRGERKREGDIEKGGVKQYSSGSSMIKFLST